MKVSTVNEMRQLDQRAVQEYGVIEELLMENAGEAAYFAITQRPDLSAACSFLVICGAGNNGGDGLVVARKLHSVKKNVQVVLTGNPDKFKNAARTNYDIIRKLPVRVRQTGDISEIQALIRDHDVIIDAIFGTGLDRRVGGIYADIIAAINASGKPVVSLDIPSGVNGDNGRVMGCAVQADCTVTFGLPKMGNLLYPGFSFGGQLFVTHISFPPELYDNETIRCHINQPPALPPRPADAHKGSCGKALFIAGAAGYLGAPYFAAQSFLKAGGGLSYLAIPKSAAPFISTKGPEIVLVPLAETKDGSSAASNLKTLLEFSRTVDFVVIGPGMSLQAETQQLVRDFCAACDRPLLIDGDGITAVSTDPSLIKKRTAPTVLTPHPGEMLRLAGGDMAALKDRPVEILRRTCSQLQAGIVLKGAHSLVGQADGNIFINLSGNAGMATAGSGDVLTGTIAAMSGQGLQMAEAARLGVFAHGLAGDIAAGDTGQDGLVAGDILQALPRALSQLRRNPEEIWRDRYGKIIII